MSDLIAIKDKEQRKALNSWAKAGYKGTIIAGTGFGKSRLAVLAAGLILTRDGGKGILLVPTVQLQAQFKLEFIKWGYEDILKVIDIVCYSSAHKLKDNKYTIVIADEIHLGLSGVFRKFFTQNRYNCLLCLTATTPEEPEYLQVLINMAPIVYHLSLDKCVELGMVSPYEIYCVPVEMTSEEQALYKKANNLFVQCKYKLGQFDAFVRAGNILNGLIPGDKAAAAMFYKAIRDRKEVVQHAVSKITVAKKIIKLHPKKKVLIFSGTNMFTETMAKQLKGLAYHSGKSQKVRAEILEDFKKGKNLKLCSTKALNQGFNVPDSEIGIIAGLDSKALPMIQRVGRLLRYQEGKTGKVYILYVKASQEQKWLEKAVKSLQNVKWLNSITDIDE